MKCFLLVVFAVSSVAGCAGFAETPAALHGPSYSKSNTYCYGDDVRYVEEKVKAFLQACYKPTTGSITTPVAGAFVSSNYKVNFAVVEGVVPGGIQYSVKTDYGYTFGAEVLLGNSECKVKLQMYAINAMWARAFDDIDNHIKGKEINCPL